MVGSLFRRRTFFTVDGWLWLRLLVFSLTELLALGSGCIAFSLVINRLLAPVTVALSLRRCRLTTGYLPVLVDLRFHVLLASFEPDLNLFHCK
ncbi:hypothetical protein F2Q69_00003190 [Brassica cretica]|uniref:Uncharacterized protein n=1 Tax=Brassica cretica TaxID=69181 RepID=A0A8S9PCJ9_BRACR|nr:hypothetical protein F2Q69_00003190 [Brassica cretica]